MHRWHFQRIFRTLVPLILLLAVLCGLMVSQRSVGAGRAFLADEAYGNLSVARSLVEDRCYGFRGDRPIPVTRDTLWRLLVGACVLVVRDPVSASYLLGAICAVITVLVLVRLARLLFPFPPFILYAGILLILSPGFLLDILSGTSGPLATVLITGACLFHVEGLQGRRVVLPTLSVLMVGLAAWLRLELALLWFVFSVHAGILARFSRSVDDAAPESSVPVRAFGGLMVLALFILPLIAWNVVQIKVPWPRAVGAAMTLDAWSQPGEAFAASMALYGQSLPQLLGAFYTIPFLSGWLQRLLFWFGTVVVVALSLWRVEERPFTLIVVTPLLFPVVLGLVYPYVGGDGSMVLYRAMGPLAVLIAVFGIFRIPFLVEGLYRKWKQGLPAAMGFNTWWIAMGSVFLLFSILQSAQMTKEHMGKLADSVATRTVLSELVTSETLQDQRWVTDSPGWVSYAWGAEAVDLTGEASTDVLLCLTPDGRIDSGLLTEHLLDKKPRVLLLWYDAYAKIAGDMTGKTLHEPGVETGRSVPRLVSLTWPDDS